MTREAFPKYACRLTLAHPAATLLCIASLGVGAQAAWRTPAAHAGCSGMAVVSALEKVAGRDGCARGLASSDGGGAPGSGRRLTDRRVCPNEPTDQQGEVVDDEKECDGECTSDGEPGDGEDLRARLKRLLERLLRSRPASAAAGVRWRSRVAMMPPPPRWLWGRRPARAPAPAPRCRALLSRRLGPLAGIACRVLDRRASDGQAERRSHE